MRLAAAVVPVISLALLSCSNAGTGASGASPPTAPTGPSTPAGPICRTYAASYSHLTTTPAGVTHTTANCQFDTGARAMTCTVSQSSPQQGCTIDSESRTTYATLADFVTEPVGTTNAIQTVSRGLSLTPASCPAGPSSNTTTTYAYDSAGRLLQVSTTSLVGPPVVTSYVFWDARGRPTSGSMMTSGQASTIVSFIYDDPTRSYLQLTTEAGGSTFATTVTYDLDGLPLRSTGESPDGPVDTVFTTTSRAQVCQ